MEFICRWYSDFHFSTFLNVQFPIFTKNEWNVGHLCTDHWSPVPSQRVNNAQGFDAFFVVNVTNVYLW